MPKEFRHIIRIADTDLNGTQQVAYALRDIKGVGIRLANIIAKEAGIPSETRLGYLTDVEVKKIEDIIEEPSKYGISVWLLNRQKDSETGKDIHRIGSDLVLQVKNDIELLKKIRSWRGFRHAYGLKVRGQRTKSTGRKGKTLGVKKKLVKARE
jgi:small subunit ribosomal protein S13